MSVEVEKKQKNLRGVSVYTRVSVSKEEIKQSNYDILEYRKREATKALGEHLGQSLDLFKEVDNEDGGDMLEYEAGLVCIKEEDYKQMVALISMTLRDGGVHSSLVYNVRKLLIDIIG